MKKKGALIFGLPAILLAFSLVLAGCDDPNNSDTNPPTIPEALRGVWTDEEYTVTLTATTVRWEYLPTSSTVSEDELVDLNPVTLTGGAAYDDGYRNGYALLCRSPASGRLSTYNFYLHTDNGTIRDGSNEYAYTYTRE